MDMGTAIIGFVGINPIVAVGTDGQIFIIWNNHQPLPKFI
jgi:hypothetical protein